MLTSRTLHLWNENLALSISFLLTTLLIFFVLTDKAIHFADGLSENPRERWGHLFNDSMWMESDGMMVKFAVADAVRIGEKRLFEYHTLYSTPSNF
jgi:hypothetical protein